MNWLPNLTSPLWCSPRVSAWRSTPPPLSPARQLMPLSLPTLVVGAGSMAKATLAASWIDVEEHSQLLAALESAALVVSCTSADHHILTRDLSLRAVGTRTHHPGAGSLGPTERH